MAGDAFDVLDDYAHGIAAQLRASGVRLTGERDSRGVAVAVSVDGRAALSVFVLKALTGRVELAMQAMREAASREETLPELPELPAAPSSRPSHPVAAGAVEIVDDVDDGSEAGK